MKPCENCGVNTPNPKFCSRSCAAKKTNSIEPKRKRTRKCSKCDDIIRTWRDSLCEKHFEEKKSLDIMRCASTMLCDYWSRESIKNKHPSWRNSHIRELNRRWNKSLTKIPCFNCGYEKHVELAHIKSISSFPETATLGEVNHPNNVIQLCPNCHWEFDHGLLKLK